MRWLVGIWMVMIAFPARADSCDDDAWACFADASVPQARRAKLARELVAKLGGDDDAADTVRRSVFRAADAATRKILLDGLAKAKLVPTDAAKLVPRDPAASKKLRALLATYWSKHSPNLTMQGEPAKLYLSRRAALAGCVIAPVQAGKKLRLECEDKWCRTCFEESVRTNIEIAPGGAWRVLSSSHDSSDAHHGCGICY